jgi:hypothetical protein
VPSCSFGTLPFPLWVSFRRRLRRSLRSESLISHCLPVRCRARARPPQAERGTRRGSAGGLAGAGAGCARAGARCIPGPNGAVTARAAFSVRVGGWVRAGPGRAACASRSRGGCLRPGAPGLARAASPGGPRSPWPQGHYELSSVAGIAVSRAHRPQPTVSGWPCPVHRRKT